MGCDKIGLLVYFLSGVSIHAAQAGCDTCGFVVVIRPSVFQFTQPKRAATPASFVTSLHIRVSIHAAQAGCDEYNKFDERYIGVSIHAAQAGCDFLHQPTPLRIQVSIHAAQAGCDKAVFLLCKG